MAIHTGVCELANGLAGIGIATGLAGSRSLVFVCSRVVLVVGRLAGSSVGVCHIHPTHMGGLPNYTTLTICKRRMYMLEPLINE